MTNLQSYAVSKHPIRSILLFLTGGCSLSVDRTQFPARTTGSLVTRQPITTPVITSLKFALVGTSTSKTRKHHPSPLFHATHRTLSPRQPTSIVRPSENHQRRTVTMLSVTRTAHVALRGMCWPFPTNLTENERGESFGIGNCELEDGDREALTGECE